MDTTKTKVWITQYKFGNKINYQFVLMQKINNVWTCIFPNDVNYNGKWMPLPCTNWKGVTKLITEYGGVCPRLNQLKFSKRYEGERQAEFMLNGTII